MQRTLNKRDELDGLCCTHFGNYLSYCCEVLTAPQPSSCQEVLDQPNPDVVTPTRPSCQYPLSPGSDPTGSSHLIQLGIDLVVVLVILDQLDHHRTIC